MDIIQTLSPNSYPGRGILVGHDPTGSRVLVAYFIMGRSVNSRNRVFVADGEGIRTQAFDPALLTDPSLVIYAPVRRINGRTIVTNGDQTDTICGFLERGRGFNDALRTRTFEPDAPNFTPRISAIVYPDGAYSMSVLKAADPNGSAPERMFFEYASPAPGEGRLIHTYLGDGSPLPSFWGEPRLVALDQTDAAQLAEHVWSALNEDNRVSLYCASIDIASGKMDSVIINKNRQEVTR